MAGGGCRCTVVGGELGIAGHLHPSLRVGLLKSLWEEPGHGCCALGGEDVGGD